MKNQNIEIQKLIKARAKIERKLRYLDLKIDHVLFRMDEERRCFARKCPLEDCDLSGTPSTEHAPSGDNEE